MSKHFHGQRRTGDPGDTRRFLIREGWRLVDEEKGREYWVGYYQNGDRSLEGGIMLTASGKRRYFVKDPHDAFIQACHDGGCLPTRSNLVRGAYEVHFSRKPDAIVDGICRIEDMM